MYLTRMYLNQHRRGAARLMASPQRMHAAVMSSFPPDVAATDSGRPLWRVDCQEDRVALMVASPDEPDMSHLVEQAGWQTGEMWQTRPYGPFLESLDAGQRWAFRLNANPTYSGRKEGWHDTKPRGHTTAKHQERWFLERCARWGFEVPDGPTGDSDLRIVDRRTLRFRRNDGHVTLTTATYEGLLVVADAALLRNALKLGVGRGKAYGCGLLTLAPLGVS